MPRKDLQHMPDWTINNLSDTYADRGDALSDAKKMNKIAREKKLKVRFYVKPKKGKIAYTNIPKTYWTINHRG